MDDDMDDDMITPTALTPEALGDVGEDRFRSLCSAAGVICNKSERDRTGWDFRVELPFDEQNGAALDQRSPRVCQVQVKATAGESGSRITAKLSAIERLAKDVVPAAIIILRLRHDGSPVAGYVVHLIDDDLGRVLRRLRKASADARRDLNHMTISFDYAKARRFDLTPGGLRQVLEEICGDDIAGYTERKQSQLADLGYGERGGLEAEALIWIDGPDHLTRILTGLAPLKPLRLQAYDRRFDIRLPYTGPLLDGLKEFSLQLPHAGPCEVAIRNGPRAPAALFKCEAFVPPPIADGPLMVIRHPLLAIVFKPDGLDFETIGVFNEGRPTLDEWRLLLRGLSYLASGSGSIALEFGGARLPPVAVPEKGLDGPYVEELPRLLEFVDRWGECLALAGVSPTEPFALDEIWEADLVQMIQDMLFNPAPVARLEFDVVEGSTTEQVLDALYFNAATFAGASISLALKVSLTRTGEAAEGFSSTAFELLDIRPAVADLKTYGAQIAGDHALSILIDPDNVLMNVETKP